MLIKSSQNYYVLIILNLYLPLYTCPKRVVGGRGLLQNRLPNRGLIREGELIERGGLIELLRYFYEI